MAKKLQLRRGTTTQHGSFTGDVGECTVDTDKDTLVVHDNSTQGGFPLAREDLNNVSSVPSGITATTQASSDNSTKIATTAYVTTAIGNISTTSISSGNSNVTVTNNAQTTVTANNVEAAEFGTAGIIFNDSGEDRDFRVESDDNANMLVLDGELNRVGIGTNAPNTTFDVRGDSGVQNNSGNTIHQLSQAGGAVFNEQGASADFRVEGNSQENLFFVDGSSDRVGIRTNTPDSGLDVNADLRVSSGTNSSALVHFIGQDGSARFNEGGSSVDFRVEGNTDENLLFIDGSSDEVGIGTNSPGNKLHVAGATQVDGNVIVTDGNNLQFNPTNNTQNINVRINADDATEAYNVTLPPEAPDGTGEVMAVASGTTSAELEWTKPWRVPVQSGAPSNAVQGDLWWDTDDARLYIYISDTNIVNEASWVAASPV